MRAFLERLRRILVPIRLFQKNARSLIGFELLFRVLTVLVFFPLLTWIARLFLFFNGTNAIAAYNAKRILMNPLTWIVTLFLCLLITIFAMFERFAIVDTLHASRCGLRRSVRQITRTAIDLTAERLKLRNWGLVPYTIFVLHFGMLIDISNVTSFIRIPGFVLEEFDKYPWKNAIFVICILFLIYLFLRWIFAIPIMMEGDVESFREAWKKSWDMTRGPFIIYVFIAAAMWTAATFALIYVVSAVIVFVWFLLYHWLLPGNGMHLAAFFMENITPVYLIMHIGFSWVTGPMILTSYQALFYERKRRLGEKYRPYTEEADYLTRKPAMRVALIASILVCVFFSGPRVFAQVRWIMNTQYGMPMVMAHRGYSAVAPENTIPAFEKAIEAGITAAELDVQMTKDGEIVVLHDSNLKRVTGVNKNIWDVTYDEIKNLDAGSFFSKEYAGTHIPTLAEVLRLCQNHLFLNIEIKRTGHDEGIVERTIDTIIENGMLEFCDITSQDYKTIEEVRSINESVLTAYTSIIGMGNLQKLEAADILSIQETFATYPNIENLHSAGKRVFVWTVNEEKTMEKLIALNVDAILTNDPVLCKKVIDKYAGGAMNIIRRLQNLFVFM